MAGLALTTEGLAKLIIGPNSLLSSTVSILETIIFGRDVGVPDWTEEFVGSLTIGVGKTGYLLACYGYEI